LLSVPVIIYPWAQKPSFSQHRMRKFSMTARPGADSEMLRMMAGVWV